MKYLLSTILVLSLYACGGGGNDDKQDLPASLEIHTAVHK